MEEDVVFDGGYQVPGSIYSRLFDYQKTGSSCAQAWNCLQVVWTFLPCLHTLQSMDRPVSKLHCQAWLVDFPSIKPT